MITSAAAGTTLVANILAGTDSIAYIDVKTICMRVVHMNRVVSALIIELNVGLGYEAIAIAGATGSDAFYSAGKPGVNPAVGSHVAVSYTHLTLPTTPYV